jgi:hypothetical protein
LVKQPLTRFIFPEDQDIYYSHRKKLVATKLPQECDLRMMKKVGVWFWAHMSDTILDSGDKGSLSKVILSDITIRKRLEHEQARLMGELQKAMSEIKTLTGIIPICANCKKIRNDTGSWEALEKYFMEHSDAQFSHGICNECVKTLYPEYADKIFEEISKDKDKSG